MDLARILESEHNGKILYQFLHHKRNTVENVQKKKQKIGAYQQYKNSKRK